MSAIARPQTISSVPQGATPCRWRDGIVERLAARAVQEIRRHLADVLECPSHLFDRIFKLFIA